MGLEIKVRRVNVRSDNTQAFLQRVLSNDEQHQCAVTVVVVELRARNQGAIFSQGAEALLFGEANGFLDDGDLCASLGEEVLVLLGVRVRFGACSATPRRISHHQSPV